VTDNDSLKVTLTDWDFVVTRLSWAFCRLFCSLFSMNVSFYPSLWQPKVSQDKDVLALLEDIKAGRWCQEVAAARAALGTPEYNACKQALPGYTASGTFHRRANDALVQHSGLLCLDVDAKENGGVDLAAVRRQVEDDTYSFAVFSSVGGVGLAVLVRIAPDNHLGSYHALAAYYKQRFGLVVDASCKDVSRFRFVSHDPELFLNEASALFIPAVRPEVKPATLPRLPIAPGGTSSSSQGQYVLDRARAMVLNSVDGNKHYQLRDAAYLCGGYIASGYVQEDEAFQVLLEAIRAKSDVQDVAAAEKTIRSGFREGRKKPLLPDNQQCFVRQQARRGQSQEAIVAGLRVREGLHSPHLAAAVAAVLDAPNPTIATFWKHVSGSKSESRKLAIDRVKLRQWLTDEGFCYRPAGEKIELLRVQNNIVHRCERYGVKLHVLTYIKELPARFDDIEQADLEELVLTQVRSLFDKELLECLSPLDRPFICDDRQMARFFFRNVWVEVTAATLTSRSYADLPGLIWQSQVKPHDFFGLDVISSQTCDFHQFMINVTGTDADRLAALRRALGYLLHGYKEADNARAVVLLDQVGAVGKPAGGTGKSLLLKAVGQLVKTTELKGATFDFQDPFRFQLVDDDTRLVYFDEWDGRRLPFKKLFSEITSALVVNRKNKPAVVLPFEDSPKWAITL
jgi:hypothetical protein